MIWSMSTRCAKQKAVLEAAGRPVLGWLGGFRIQLGI